MIDYSVLAFPKGRPAVLERDEARTNAATADKKAKAAVMAADEHTCRVCGRPATEVHEALKFKSRGGVASLRNSIAVCARPTGKCHQYLQQHLIGVVGTNCRKRLVFEMRPEIVAKVFARRPVPAHVRRLT